MKEGQRLNCEVIISALKAQGFHMAGLLKSEDLPENILINSNMPEHSSIIIAFFPYNSIEKTRFIAPFAIKNHYKDIINRMKQALKESGSPLSELSRKQLRFFSNSPFPEKEMALSAGLGFRGRNTLIINSDFGSRGLLGGMIIPYKLKNDDKALIQKATRNNTISCGSCRLCEDACPGGALGEYKLERNKCLQHWTSQDGIVPDALKEAWGERIYGCTICQDCCPWNRKEKKGITIKLGGINPEPELQFYLNESPESIKKRFKGTALGMSWIKAEHLIRNAIISSRYSEDKKIIGEIRRFLDSENPGIRDAARWRLKKSDQTGN